MAIFSHHEFRLRTPEFLQSFDKCDNLCYKYIKDIHIFEYWHSFFLNIFKGLGCFCFIFTTVKYILCLKVYACICEGEELKGIYCLIKNID